MRACIRPTPLTLVAEAHAEYGHVGQRVERVEADADVAGHGRVSRARRDNEVVKRALGRERREAGGVDAVVVVDERLDCCVLACVCLWWGVVCMCEGREENNS